MIYIPGNHDDDLRRFCGTRFGHIEIVRQAVHTTRSGRRRLIVRGDEFDSIIQCSPLLVSVGAAAYGMLLSVNRLVHWTRQRLDRPYWSAARHVKSRMKHAVDYAERFKEACLLAAAEARVEASYAATSEEASIRVSCRLPESSSARRAAPWLHSSRR